MKDQYIAGSGSQDVISHLSRSASMSGQLWPGSHVLYHPLYHSPLAPR